ncbi:MAG: ComF family protein, partial [Chloroflexi bacterium]
MDLALAVRDVLLVPRCAGCGEPGSWFCFACRDQCEPVAHDGRLALRAAGPHAGPLRAAVRRLKYGGEPGLAEELGALVALEVARDLAGGVTLDAIVPVPLHRLRAAARGYDQA